MAIEDILKALEAKANARIEAIMADAGQRVKEIKSEVERDAARTRRLRLKKVEEQIRSEATGIVYSASLRAKNHLIRAQEEAVEEAFRVAEQRLAGMSGDPDYPLILESLLDECLSFLPQEVVLEVRAEDRTAVEKMMEDRKRPYTISEEPLQASGGLVARSASGDVVVVNTFESRLEKAKDKLRLKIANALFSAGDH